jgi:hypothetical protein
MCTLESYSRLLYLASEKSGIRPFRKAAGEWFFIKIFIPSI